MKSGGFTVRDDLRSILAALPRKSDDFTMKPCGFAIKDGWQWLTDKLVQGLVRWLCRRSIQTQ